MTATAGSPMTTTAGSPMTSTAGMLVSSKPENIPPVGDVQPTAFLLPIAGGPTAGGPNTGGPTSGGPAIDGPSQGGGQSSSSSAAQSGRSTECVCPMDGTVVIHPIGVPCASLNCPLCGSRLVNATPTGSSTDATNAIVNTAGAPTAGGPNTGGPTAGGPAIDGSTLGGSTSGSAQSGRSSECVCPMDGTLVLHPIGVPCAALTCPICGSRLVNATPTGSSPTTAVAAPIVPVAGNTKKIVVPSSGKNLNSEIAPMLDNAPYFLMFGIGTYDVVKNPYAKDTRATGAEVAQFIVGEGGSVVICNNVSMTALKTFKDLQVKVYTGFTGTVQQAVDIYSDGRLKNSDSISGGVVSSTDATSEEEKKGPPASKSKSKEKEDTTVF
jgi:predicted Fe-Mo cluster-binding NifX family protein